MANTQERSTSSTRQLLSPAYFWSILRAPETFSLSLLVMAFILSLGMVIPQQAQSADPSAATDEFEIWAAGLTGFFQQFASTFNALGLFRIFNTTWFWVPAAWLVLVTAIIGADYTPLIWARFWKKWADLTPPHPHPFNRRLAKIIRAPSPSTANKSAASETPLAHLQTNLEQAGYIIHTSDDQQQLTVMRSPQRWGGPAFVSFGILMMLIGFSFQALWGHSAQIEAAITPAETALLAKQTIQIESFTPALDDFNQIIGGDLVVNVNDVEPVTWRLYRPYQVADWWIIPGGIYPVAQIKLTQNQSPVETIEQVFPSPTTPVQFIYSDQELVFELHYLPSTDGPSYQLKLATGADEIANLPEIVQDGINFSIPDFGLNGQVTINEKLRLYAYQISPLGALIIVAGLLLAAAGLGLLALAPPDIIWLKAITKGRGSRIEVEAEILRTMPPDEETLNQTLVLPPLDRPND